MRRLTLFISVALAMLVFAIPATAGAKSRHSKRHHHARIADRNHNGIPDSWERKFRVHKATADPDRDGVTNIGEFHNGTNPRDADSNDNGIPDGSDDANDDGIADGQEQSGTIASFENGVLTVTLVNGDTLKGTVDNGTEIECDDAVAPTTASTRDDGGDTQSSGDNSGSGSTSSGEGSDDNTTASTTTQQGDDNEQGDNDNEQGDDDQGEDANCTTADLTQGTIVKEAELHLTSGGAVFDKIELGGKASA